MSDENLRQLHDQLRTAQDKYTYFMLAAAASAVAFAVTRTDGLLLSWSMVPLGLAVTGQVPAFIEEGEVIRVSTIDSTYSERAR